MNDEKKLNDEAVEGVSGGYVPQGRVIDQKFFNEVNCRPCTNRRNCPKNFAIAFEELGGAPCPDYTGPGNAWHPHPKSEGV